MKASSLFRLSLALLAPALTGILHAQTDASSYPGGPVLNRAGDFSSWRITCEEVTAAATPGKANRPSEQKFKTMLVIKTKNFRSIETTDVAGAVTKRFFVGALEAMNAPDTTIPRYYNTPGMGAEGDYIDFSQSDFPECNWINASLYTGVEMIAGHKCLVFKEGEKTDDASVAYVDSETRLPVKNQVGSLTYTYEFLSAPTEMLEVPALVKARIDFENKRTKNLTARPATY